MDKIKSVFSKLRGNVSLRRYLPVFALIIGLIWFIPPVWRLKNDSIEVTRWIKSKGKITAKVGPKESNWTKYNRISRHTINAVVSSEDSKFYQHHGFDFEAINDSVKVNLKKGTYHRGGSTITQQLVKVSFLSRDKTILRKAREAVGALLAELILDKKTILEWYLNLVEFGDGVYGLEAAAKHYFGTKPEMLTTSQSIHLALVLPSPNSWSAGLRKRNLTPFGHRRFAAIVTNMYRGGFVTKEQWISALAAGNFGGPINGYQSVISDYEAESLPTMSDPRLVAPDTGEPEESIDSDQEIQRSEGSDQGTDFEADPTESSSDATEITDGNSSDEIEQPEESGTKIGDNTEDNAHSDSDVSPVKRPSDSRSHQ